jgi:VWFA-related protein
MSKHTFPVLALAFATLVPVAVRAPAQEPAAPPARPEPSIPVFGTESSVVLLDVIVRDRRGRLVRDLTPADFEVFEDGERQPLTAFRLVDGGRIRVLPVDGPSAGPSDAQGGAVPPEVRPSAAPQAQETTPTPTPPRASEAAGTDAVPTPCVIAFLFDRLSARGRDTARKAALAYTKRGHVDGDIVGVFALDLALHTLQPFTTDLDSVRAAFERAGILAQTAYADVRDKERELASDARRLEQSLAGLGVGTTADTSASTAAMNLSVQREFALLQAGMLRSFDRLERDQQGFASTNGLLALVNGLKVLPGRKTIVFFSEGLTISSNVLAQFRSVIASANRSNVSVYAIDAGGLRIESGTEEARKELVATADRRLAQEGRGFLDSSDGALTQGQERAEDLLRLNPQASLGQLAEETGGFLVADTNDTARGFQRIQEEMRSYYLLSYSPTNTSFDGRFRTISVKVHRPHVEVHSRKGYFAVAPDTSVPVRTFENPVLAQLDRRPRPSDFPIAATALSFPESSRPGRVPVMVELPASALTYTLDPDGQTYRAEFSVVARIRDARGREVDRLSRDYPLAVPADKIEAAKGGDVLFFQETDLAPGRYTLEAGAWDSVGKKASVRTATVTVPGFHQGDLRLSSLVLLRRVEKLGPLERGTDNPLYYGETIVYPNMGEPFHKSVTPNVGFFFSAYEDPGHTPPREAVVEILKDGALAARQGIPLPGPEPTGRIQRAGAVPVESLPPGEYTLRVTVSNDTESASQRARFVIEE